MTACTPGCCCGFGHRAALVELLFAGRAVILVDGHGRSISRRGRSGGVMVAPPPRRAGADGCSALTPRRTRSRRARNHGGGIRPFGWLPGPHRLRFELAKGACQRGIVIERDRPVPVVGPQRGKLADPAGSDCLRDGVGRFDPTGSPLRATESHSTSNPRPFPVEPFHWDDEHNGMSRARQSIRCGVIHNWTKKIQRQCVPPLGALEIA